MRLELQESGVKIQAEKFACDKSLHNSNKIPACLPKQSFSMAIVAPPASGKTTLLINLLCRWYDKSYDRVYFFMPESSRKSIKNKKLMKHFDCCQDQCYDDLNPDTLGIVMSAIEADNKRGLFSLIVCDDITANLKSGSKRNSELMALLKRALTNRRHLGLSIIMCVHKWNLLETPIRNY